MHMLTGQGGHVDEGRSFMMHVDGLLSLILMYLTRHMHGRENSGVYRFTQ